MHLWCTLGDLGIQNNLIDLLLSSTCMIFFQASGTNHPALFTNSLFTTTPHWIHSNPHDFDVSNSKPFKCRFRFQHVHPLMDCWIKTLENGELEIELEFPLRAITPGQYAVFYIDNECIGSAQITRPGPTLYDQNITQPIKHNSTFSWQRIQLVLVL